MPASTRYSRASSPARSSAYTNSSPQSKLNIVQRLTVEVKADRNVDDNGAPVKMFLRLSIPVSACTPGATIPLFPEENLKIIRAYVHPLDQSSVPYNFTHYMLRRAARALGLPNPSSELYQSLFDSVRAPMSPTVASPDLDVLEAKYVGEITVNQYQVCYVPPREFPLSTRSYDGSYGRRTSANQLQFMAAIEIWAPFIAKPPQHPYLLKIPVPRCLNNFLAVKVYSGPKDLSSSAASLASVPTDDWRINCVPTLNAPSSGGHKRSLSRSTGSLYQHFADDESSDSSGGVDGWTRTNGTFPTTESMTIRWASARNEDVPTTSDNRRRAGFREVNGETSCVILDREDKGRTRGRSGAASDQEGVLMQLDYTATCTGLIHPSSAWLLGFDVQLDAGDCEVTWAPDEKPQWSVQGGKAFCGWWVGPPPPSSHTRRPSSSSESPAVRVQPATPSKVEPVRKEEQRWTSSSSSLLRAPLPSLDDSLSESSPIIESTPLSSLNSSAVTTVPSSPERRSRASSIAPEEMEPGSKMIFSPKIPVSVHIDAGRMIPPQTSTFTFNISGTVLVKPPEKPFHLHRSFSGADAESETDPIVIPTFRVLYAENQVVSSLVRNDMPSAALDIFNLDGSIHDPQTRKTVVQPRSHAKLGTDGARFAIRAVESPRSRSRSMRDRSVDISGRRTPNGLFSRPGSAMSTRSTPRRRRTDGKAEVTHVVATVTPEFASEGNAVPTEYEVRLVADVDGDPEGDTEWLGFGLPRPVRTAGAHVELPKVNITKVTLDGTAALYETTTIEKPGGRLPALGFPLEEDAPKESMTWVQVHLGDACGGKVQVEYSVSMPANLGEKLGGKERKSKGRGTDVALLDVLLPTFELPVGKMEVRVPEPKGFTITPTRSNFPNRQEFSEGSVLIRRAVEELFHPELTVTIAPILPPAQPKSGSPAGWWTILAVVICTIPTVISLLTMSENRTLITERGEMKQALDALSASLAALPTETPLPLTVTSTHLSVSVSTVTIRPEPTQPSPEQVVTPIPSSSTSTPTTTSTIASASSLPTLTPTVISASTPSATDAILPFRDLPFLWPIHFDIPPLDIPETARATAAVLARGLGFAWQLCRKVFHYPLDPP
ncbi:hypothetical protein PsYK624_126250 [Phanerochaete sordida]|uniref:Uncharacterized protein n=1 Tax=Phanerochaete sordida TaxID=48140 RepID=A0A9P3GK59_9APHY|nr:hypothetical protein PsYK624_126250 [Phanerochaete sordida]